MFIWGLRALSPTVGPSWGKCGQLRFVWGCWTECGQLHVCLGGASKRLDRVWAALDLFGVAGPSVGGFRFVWGVASTRSNIWDASLGSSRFVWGLDRVWAALCLFGVASAWSNGWTECGQLYVCLGDCEHSVQQLNLCGQL